ncbi:hypothetical protein NKH18_43530 [Streptomyces sp. M10(2022)]
MPGHCPGRRGPRTGRARPGVRCWLLTSINVSGGRQDGGHDDELSCCARRRGRLRRRCRPGVAGRRRVLRHGREHPRRRRVRPSGAGIAAYEEQHPRRRWPTRRPGRSRGRGRRRRTHTVPMLSLDNVFSAGQFATWTASLERRIGRPVTAWSVEPKLDGLAVAARYRAGRLDRLITRGDGTAGEDVSHAIGTVLGLPEQLGTPVTIEVRGEILMTNEQFEQANTVRTEHGGAPSPTRATARRARCAPGQALPGGDDLLRVRALALPDSGALTGTLAGLPHSEVLRYVAGLGVHTAADTQVAPRTVTTVEQVQSGVEDIAALRASLPFGIDGIVIKADLAADQQDAGSGTVRRAGPSRTSSRPWRRSPVSWPSNGMSAGPASSRRAPSWSRSRSTDRP